MDVQKKVTFRFKKDEDYRLIPVNGVWGGSTPRGDIMVDFFHESQPLPEKVTQALSPDGELGKELEHKPLSTLQRTVFVGIVLGVEQAESIGRWLQEKASQARERRSEKGAGENERDSPTTH